MFVCAFDDVETAQQVATLVQYRLEASLPEGGGGGSEDAINVLPPLPVNCAHDNIYRLDDVYIVTDSRGVAIPIVIGHGGRSLLDTLIGLYSLNPSHTLSPGNAQSMLSTVLNQ
jgi:hypothetical protein